MKNALKYIRLYAFLNLLVTVSVGLKAQAPAVPVAEDVSRCGPGSVTLTATCKTPGVTFLWTMQDGTPIATGPTYTTVSLTSSVTFRVLARLNGVSSQGSDDVTAIIRPSPVVDAGDEGIFLWEGMTATFGSDPIDGCTYSWSPTDGLSSPTVANPTFSYEGSFPEGPSYDTYYVVTANLDGCTKTDYLRIIVTELPDVTITPHCGYTQLTCNQVIYNQEPFNIYWQATPDGTSTDNSEISINVTDPGTYYLRAVFNGIWSPAVTTTVSEIPQSAAPPELGPDIFTSVGEETAIGVAPIDGYTYSWSPAAGLSATDVANPVANPLSTTTYTLTVTSPEGCSSSSSITVQVTPAVPVAEDVSRCGPGSVTLTATCETPGVTFLWMLQDGTPIAFGPTYTTASLSRSATFKVLAILNDVPSQESDDVTAIIEPIPVANAGPDYKICEGDMVLLGDNPIQDCTYIWSASPSSQLSTLSDPNVSNPFASPTTTATFIVTMEACGTTTSDEATITIISEPVLETFSPTASENYIMITTMNVAGGVSSQLRDDSKSITYFDGLGRPKQIISVFESPEGLDVVQPVVYDQFGRENFKYLPFVSGAHGGFRQNIIEPHTKNYICTAAPFYAIGSDNKIADDIQPYAEVIYEPSPLNRIIKQGLPGEAWQPDPNKSFSSTDKSIKFSYETNSSDKVLLWRYSYSTGLIDATLTDNPGEIRYYKPNQLYKTKTKDEHSNIAIEYKDKAGRLILKRVQAMDSPSTINDFEFASTYYVYDDFGNLVYVLPPEAVKAITSVGSEYFGKLDAEKIDFLNRLAFAYKYDENRRMIKKKAPGADWIYMVYDNRNRLVMTQDGNQRQNSTWTFAKYDVLNRVILTGLFKDLEDKGQDAMQEDVNEFYRAADQQDNSDEWFETRENDVHGYTNHSFPKVADEGQYLTVTYYDDYEFRSSWNGDYNYVDEWLSHTVNSINYTQPKTPFARLNGHVTGTKVKVLDGGATGGYTWLKTINYYDEKYRLIQVISDNYKGGEDRTTTLFDFPGKILTTRTTTLTRDITWTSLVEVKQIGNKLVNKGAGGWGSSGASSFEVLSPGLDGWVEWMTSETTTDKIVGLSAVNQDASYATVKYAFLQAGDGKLYIYENGVNRFALGNYKPGETLRIERTGDNIAYKRNGSAIYPSTVPSTTQLVVDAGMNDTNASLIDIRSSFSTRTTCITRTFEYDHAGRLLETRHQVDSSDEVSLSRNQYNELGQLVIKRLHKVGEASPIMADPLVGEPGVIYNNHITLNQYNGEKAYIANTGITLQAGFQIAAGNTFTARIGYSQEDVDAYNAQSSLYAQVIDYRYNIRGWLTRINDADLMPDRPEDPRDLFGMNLLYNEVDNNVNNEAQFNGNISAMKWSTNLGLGDEPTTTEPTARAYTFIYDPLKRLKGAVHYENINSLWNASVAFHEDNITYDLNSNIKSLNRTNRGGVITDLLTYYYGEGTPDHSNKLLYVADGVNNPEGFKDGANAGNDYDYDKNGNMIYDLNKSIGTSLIDVESKISYNYLNLPEIVQKSATQYINYIYDASGRKLHQHVADGSAEKRTDYQFDYIYENDKLLFINHEEGRIVISENTPEYQYYIKDHLGNVRLTFTTEESMESATATLETSNASEENPKFLNYAEVRKIDSKLFDHTNAGGTYNSTRLMGGNSSEVYGLAKSLSVMPGDTIRMEVYAKYLDPNSDSWSVALQNIISAIAGTVDASGTYVDGGPVGGTEAPFPYPDLLVRENDDGIGPKAYLNYLLFDRDFNYLGGGFKRVPASARESGDSLWYDEEGSGHEPLTFDEDIVIQEPGYMYIYLSTENETPVEVFFDDFKVEHIQSPVIQMDDYYPFGLTFNSYQRENSVKNKYLYNDGAEREDALDLGVDATKFRMYDPSMGRWWQVDPLADEGDLVTLTPYNYSYNNPVRYNDPDGDCPRCPRPQYRAAAAQHYSNTVRRDLVTTSYRYHNGANPGRTVPGGSRPGIEVGNHKSPQTQQGGLVTAIVRIGGEYKKFNEKLNVNVDKQEIFSGNGAGGQKSEGSKYVFSGPDAAKLEMMENSHQGKANEAYNEKFAAFATEKLGTDFNSLSPEAQAEFKNENSTMAPLLRSMVSMEMGPSPKEQLLQQVKDLVKVGVMAPMVKEKPLPVIQQGN